MRAALAASQCLDRRERRESEYADKRIPELLRIPAAVRFVSYEPALGPVSLGQWLDWPWWCERCQMVPAQNAETHLHCHDEGAVVRRSLDWLIVGGESGTGARRSISRGARSAVAQCKAAGVPVFVKQMGARPVGRDCEHGRALGSRVDITTLWRRHGRVVC